EAVEEEFSVWKKNTPLLYDLLVSHALEWPSLTVQWLPLPPSSSAADLEVHKIVLGTHTSGESPNFLLVADAYLPRNPSPELDPENLIRIPKVEITQRIHVDGEVNRARCLPQNPAIVAAKTCGAQVYVFDAKKQMDSKCRSCEPDLRLNGHEQEGYGLSWNPFKEGFLLSGSNDRRICLWDLHSNPGKTILDADHIYQGHEDVVEDVSWHSKHDYLFGSVGDDGKLIIWDTRAGGGFQHSVVAHRREVNYLRFNPFNEWVLATASSDSTVGIFDVRKLSSGPVYGLEGHEGEAFQVEWDPNHEAVLASSADDRRLIVWDLNRVGEEMWDGEAEDGPPELLFSHGGHRAKISDFSWNGFLPWTIASAAEDNTLQVWQLANGIIYHDDDDDE
ncbi:hypothetical protein M569_11022, partial [Genlisea aurea]